ncbi:uncharacterized protein LOC126739008 [Anthonomus grandis grandis]|uniref:uncharacterized protein LOC126739008 n=1 Tax=Anthonomus grandis grandis TaxID=2921223 RepID=UPI0021656191|nr:uncharacterized protein LOC126739008 [Anthonomus grandis grandis]
MSPASCDALEVERYIGACLFTKHHRNYHNKNVSGYVNYQEAWAGGAPLISFNNNHRRPVQRYVRDEQLAQLAQHTQGAPLIVTKNHNNNFRGRNSYVPQQTKVFENSKRLQVNKKGPQVDTASVTSDESYGSQNSEPCLPRILKPRKRRKKDRKPLNRSYNDHQYPSHQYLPYVEPPPSYSDDSSEVPKLHHSFEEVEEVEDVNGNLPSTCQCRYCDPNCQIWDVDRSCYSPFLTPPTKSFEFSNLLQSSPDLPYGLSNELSRLSLKESWENPHKPVFSRSSSNSSSSCSGDLEVSTEIVTSPNGHRDIEIKFWLSGDRSVQSDVGS